MRGFRAMSIVGILFIAVSENHAFGRILGSLGAVGIGVAVGGPVGGLMATCGIGNFAKGAYQYSESTDVGTGKDFFKGCVAGGATCVGEELLKAALPESLRDEKK